jgi:hypothetical protein
MYDIPILLAEHAVIRTQYVDTQLLLQYVQQHLYVSGGQSSHQQGRDLTRSKKAIIQM